MRETCQTCILLNLKLFMLNQLIVVVVVVSMTMTWVMCTRSGPELFCCDCFHTYMAAAQSSRSGSSSKTQERSMSLIATKRQKILTDP